MSKQRFFFIATCLLILVTFFLVLKTNGSATSISDGMECVPLTWHRTMICEYPEGHFTNYTAGTSEVVLAGDVPFDNSWDGKEFSLKGFLVQNGSCTMLVVEEATACSLPDSVK